MLALERRGGAAEHAHTAGAVGAPDGHVARVVAHALLLLEARVVLLVDDDEPESPDRREERAAGADGDVDLAGAESTPHRVALARRERRVQDRDVVAEARAEARDELGRERDLGHEDDGAAPLLARGGDGPQVDLGLSAARHAVQGGTWPGAPRAAPPAIASTAAACVGRGLVRDVARRRVREERRRPAPARSSMATRPALGELLGRGARIAPALGELRQRRARRSRARARGPRPPVRAAAPSSTRVGRGHPLHAPRAYAARRAEERRLAELARRLALDRRQREAQHLADGREVVRREVRGGTRAGPRGRRARRSITRRIALTPLGGVALAHARGRRPRAAGRRTGTRPALPPAWPRWRAPPGPRT